MARLLGDDAGSGTAERRPRAFVERVDDDDDDDDDGLEDGVFGNESTALP